VNYRENIADNLSKAGWSWGCVSAVDFGGRIVFVPMRTAMTESVSLCVPMKSWRRFAEPESVIHTNAASKHGIIFSLPLRNRWR
jgi:hypothetical protein